MQNDRHATQVALVLTPRRFAEAIGVSESSVKRWIDDGHIGATRTAGGHRRIAVQEAARYAREHRMPIVRPEILDLHEVATTPAGESLADAGDRLYEYLRDGAAAQARGLMLSMFLEGAPVAEIVDGPLVHAMSRIGTAWAEHASGIYWEHRATQIAIQALVRLRFLLAPREDAPFAVGGAPPGDRYILPSLAAAAVLEAEGLRCANLGPETPVASLALAIEDLRAPIAWMSVSVANNPATLGREIEALVPVLAERGTILVVGGAAAPELALPASDSIFVGRSMAELAALIRGMRLAPRGAST